MGQLVLLELVAEILDGVARDRLGGESWSVPLGEVDGLTFRSFEPEVGILSTDVGVEYPASPEYFDAPLTDEGVESRG